MVKRLPIVVAISALLVVQVPAFTGSTRGAPVAPRELARHSSSEGGFHELHLRGLPNAAGLSLSGVRRGGAAYVLEVSGAAVSAHPRSSRAAAESGAALKGLELDLRDRTGARFTIHIAAVGTTTYWAGTPEPVPTYELTYTSTTHRNPQPLCTAERNEALLFAGDRYDAPRKTVTATGPDTEGWFNVACVGTALAKLHLTRHTEASQTVKTTAVERQAMLKMLTGDVCGDGTSFTVHGQPLMWADANRLTTFAAPPASLEAVWTERGAVCLDTPRRPELAAAIAARCGPLPSCTNQRGYVISANPRQAGATAERPPDSPEAR
jgi:hypothetical protein